VFVSFFFAFKAGLQIFKFEFVRLSYSRQERRQKNFQEGKRKKDRK